MKTQLFLLTAAVSMSSVLQAVAAPALPPPPAMKAPSKLGAPPAPPSGAVQPASPPKPQIPLPPGGTIANEGKFANPVQGLSARERAEFNVAKSVFLEEKLPREGWGRSSTMCRAWHATSGEEPAEQAARLSHALGESRTGCSTHSVPWRDRFAKLTTNRKKSLLDFLGSL